MKRLPNWLLALVLLMVAALPAATVAGARYQTEAVATLAPSPTLHKAKKPTRDQQINQAARKRVANRPEHFRCLALADDMLTQYNAIPDANATATITFDKHTGGYAVTAVDSHQIIIGYETVYRPNRITGGTFVIDRYTWSFGPNVEPYAVFVRNVDRDGHVYWGNYAPIRNEQGAFQVSLYRGGDTATVYIVASDLGADPGTCEAGNDLPAELWDGVARLH